MAPTNQTDDTDARPKYERDYVTLPRVAAGDVVRVTYVSGRTGTRQVREGEVFAVEVNGFSFTHGKEGYATSVREHRSNSGTRVNVSTLKFYEDRGGHYGHASHLNRGEGDRENVTIEVVDEDDETDLLTDGGFRSLNTTPEDDYSDIFADIVSTFTNSEVTDRTFRAYSFGGFVGEVDEGIYKFEVSLGPEDHPTSIRSELEAAGFTVYMKPDGRFTEGFDPGAFIVLPAISADADRLTNADLSEGDVVEFDLADGRTARYEIEREWTDEDLADGMTPGLKAKRVWTSTHNMDSPLPRYRATLDLDAGHLVDNYPEEDRGDVRVRNLAKPRLVDVVDRWEVRGSVASPAASHVLRVVAEAFENDPLVSTVEVENVLIKGADESGTDVFGNDIGLTVYILASLDLQVREAFESYLHEHLNAGYWWEIERDGVFSFLVDRDGQTHPVR